jgi:hypothetical protein
LVKQEFSDRNVEGWLITDGRFNRTAQAAAKSLNVKLIDGQILKELLGKNSEQ